MSDAQLINTDDNPDRLTFLPIDPFAATPHVASRVEGLGGEHLGDEPGYVFQSLDIYPVLGPVRFTLRFHDLMATSGTLLVRVHAFSRYPGTVPMLLKQVSVPMRDLVENEGIFSVELISRRNMGYTIGGAIGDDTDARSSALSLSLDPRERSTPLPSNVQERPAIAAPKVAQVEVWNERPELAIVQPATFGRPVSQAMTAAQGRDPLVPAWNAALHQSDIGDVELWEDAFILQALHYYGVETDCGSGLGIARTPRRIPAYLAGRGCTILAAAVHRDDLPEGDPGLALEQLACPDLCTPRRFVDALHLALFEDLTIPAALTGFDFLWSTDVNSGPGARARFPHMLRAAMGCLTQGGLAIHVLRYSGEPEAPYDGDAASYGRVEIERLALSLIADGHEVAQLNFDTDRPDWPGDQHIPFALIARRIR